jgi:predicted DNA-binding transcriptional regulator AlpA
MVKTRTHYKTPAKRGKRPQVALPPSLPQPTLRQQLMQSHCSPRDPEPMPPAGGGGPSVKTEDDLGQEREQSCLAPPDFEPSIRKSTPRPPPQDSEPDRTSDRLIRLAEAQELLGGCSHMTIRRLVAGDSGFPAPVYYNRFPHFWRGDILQWLSQQAAKSRPSSPQARNIAKSHARRRGAVEAGHG